MKQTKKMTLERLARMVQGGFSEVNDKFKGVDDKFRIVFDDLRIVKDDIKDLKTALGPLARIAGEQDRELRNLNLRLARVERKVGIAK